MGHHTEAGKVGEMWRRLSLVERVVKDKFHIVFGHCCSRCGLPLVDKRSYLCKPCMMAIERNKKKMKGLSNQDREVCNPSTNPEPYRFVSDTIDRDQPQWIDEES